MQFLSIRDQLVPEQPFHQKELEKMNERYKTTFEGIRKPDRREMQIGGINIPNLTED